MNVSLSSEQSWLDKRNNPTNNYPMNFVSAELRFFSAFGIKQIHQSSSLQKKTTKEERIVVRDCLALPFSSWQHPVINLCAHAMCIHCIPSPHPLPTSSSLPTQPCILLTKASNGFPFHDPSLISIHM